MVFVFFELRGTTAPPHEPALNFIEAQLHLVILLFDVLPFLPGERFFDRQEFLDGGCQGFVRHTRGDTTGREAGEAHGGQAGKGKAAALLEHDPVLLAAVDLISQL